MSIYFGEDKTKSILFALLIKCKKIRKLTISYGSLRIKQYFEVIYLGCILDKSLSEESMVLSLVSKFNTRLKFLYRKNQIFVTSVKAVTGWIQTEIKCWPGFYIQNVILLTQQIIIYKLCEPRHLTSNRVNGYLTDKINALICWWQVTFIRNSISVTLCKSTLVSEFKNDVGFALNIRGLSHFQDKSNCCQVM